MEKKIVGCIRNFACLCVNDCEAHKILENLEDKEHDSTTSQQLHSFELL